MANVLSVTDLCTHFSMRSGTVKAVDGVSFSIEEGECLGLVGESGCGKSTVGFSIMRLLPSNGRVTGGNVNLLGRDIASYSEREMQSVRGSDVALIPQDPLTSLNPTKTIGFQIAEAVTLHKNVSKSEAMARALEVLQQVEMPNAAQRLKQFPHELSGGLRQRVMIAIALANSPKLLIADEPTTALDVTIQAQILDLIDRIRADLGMAVLLITHDMGVIAGRSDRVAVMYAGKLAEEAATNRLFTRMSHPYSQALLSSVPRMDDPNARLMSIVGLPPDLSKEIVGCRFAPRCRFAQDDCRQTEPELAVHQSDSDHRFACFHPVDGPAALPAITARTEPVEGAAENPVILDVINLVKEFPVRSNGVIRRVVGSVKAVSDVSFSVNRGETFGLVGESGCGKTTIGKLLVRLEEANSGKIMYEDSDLRQYKGTALRQRRRDLQMMFQDPYASIDPRQRVSSVLEEPLIIQGVGTSTERKAMVRDLLETVGLSGAAAQRYPHEFSGGQRQRIGLARSIALRPSLLVADEPVSALDVSIQAQILNLMKDLQKEMGLTMLLISHDLAVVRYMSDTIGVMYLGKLVEVGPAHKLYQEPAHHYTQGLLDAVPIPDPIEANKRKGLQITGELPSSVKPPSGCRFRTRCPRGINEELCASEEPPFQDFADGHRAACHFPLRTPVTLSASQSGAGAS